MFKDSYQRFLKSDIYLQILNDPISNKSTSDCDSGNVIMHHSKVSNNLLKNEKNI